MKREYQEVMNMVHMPKDCEGRILEAMERRERPRRPVRAALLFAALAALLCGSALAAGYRAGVLDLFFRGDTGVLEPYVQRPNSVSNGEYRLSVDSVLFDGSSIYAVATVEGLTPQAVEDLKSNKVIAESHPEDWGQDMVDSLLESGRAGPDTFRFRGAKGVGSSELPAPGDSSRAWKVDGRFDSWEPGESIHFWVGFMGPDYAVEIQPDVMEPLVLTPNRTIPLPDGAGQMVCTEFTVYMTGAQGVFQGVEGDVSLKSFHSLPLTVTLRDGQVLSREDLGFGGDSGTLLELEPRTVLQYNYRFETPIDLAQIASISINGTQLTP